MSKVLIILFLLTSCIPVQCSYYLFAGYKNGTIKIFDPKKDWKKVETLFGHKTAIRSLAFKKKGRYLASQSDDGIIKMWKKKYGRWRVFQTFISKKGVFVALFFNKKVERHLEKNKEKWRVKKEKRKLYRKLYEYKQPKIEKITYVFTEKKSPDKKYYAFSQMDGAIKILKFNSMETIKKIKGNKILVTELIFSPKIQKKGYTKTDFYQRVDFFKEVYIN